ncbi:MAG: PEP-utilizing enzyme [Rhodospirillaceae bacterium]|jgi:glutamine kinase|nr:PEP-utilizing enzyme [Rhodospirillaceae bacterium]
MFKFGTKAETLERLEGLVKSARILPQYRFSVSVWQNGAEEVVNSIAEKEWLSDAVIVRSSAIGEDQLNNSQAGNFVSVPDVVGATALTSAVETVIHSFGDSPHENNQIFVQPYLKDIAFSGVALTQETGGGGHYFVVNYDDTDGRTDSVESGLSGSLKTLYLHKGRDQTPPERFCGVIELLWELDSLIEGVPLDVEFAVTTNETVFLLQVRPVSVPRSPVADIKIQGKILSDIAGKVRKTSRPHPYLYGSKSIFGVMPDWNPAEIIGIRPKPLSLSLYKDLVTDSIWAYQRNNYGYKNLRSFPLLISLGGIPYIDVRVSFNSFLPHNISDDLAERLANHYIDRLVEQPNLQDKVEFEIIYSCLTLDLPERLEALKDFGFSGEDLSTLIDHLRPLTNRAIHGKTGLWRDEITKIAELKRRQDLLLQSKLDPVSKIYWLIEDCKRYGTLPFAGLARAGFIAMQMLRSLVSKSILSEDDLTAFLSQLHTVASDLSHDQLSLSKQEFIKKYGFLRPGTYDICSKRYDESPDEYFDWSQRAPIVKENSKFTLSENQLKACDRLLADMGIKHTAIGFFDFIKSAIEGREYAKFVFSKSISEALRLLEGLASNYGFSRDDTAYTTISVVKDLYETSTDPTSMLHRSIESGRELYELNQQICLPPLIVDPTDIACFEISPSHPNYVTRKTFQGPVWRYGVEEGSIDGKIVFLPNADPGFDWIFTRQIAGFVTMYGGVNSHMAIRSNELGMPAVIGAGEQLYALWAAATKLEIDCNNKLVRKLL